MAIGKLVIEMEANVAHLRKDMANAANDIKKVAGAINFVKRAAIGLGAAMSVRAIVNYARSAITAADATVKMAHMVGLTAEEFQGLSIVAIQAGMEQGGFSKALQLLNVSIGDTARGTGTAKDAFKELKIGVRDSVNGGLKPAYTVFLEIADALQRYKTEAERASLASDIFGRSGKDMLVLFKQNSAAIKDEIARLKDLGQFFSNELGANAEIANDRLGEMDKALKILGMNAILNFAPAIAEAASAITKFIAELDKANTSSNLLKESLGWVLRQAKNTYDFIDLVVGSAASGAAGIWESIGDFGDPIKASAIREAAFGGFLENYEEKFNVANKITRDERYPKIGKTPYSTISDPEAIKKAASDRDKSLKALDKYFADLLKMERESLNDRELSLLGGLMKEVRAEQQAMQARVDAITERRDEMLAVENLMADEKQRIIAGSNKAIESEAITSIARITRLTLDANAEIMESNRRKNEEILQGIIELDEAERQAVADRKRYYTDFADDIEERNLSMMQLYRRDMATLTAGFQAGFLDETAFKNSTKILTDEYNGWIEASRRTAQTIEGSFSDLFFGVMQGNLDNLVTNFIAAMDRIVADLAARQLFNWLAGSLGGGGGFLFGGGRALGGPVSVGSAYMVGERGPEMFIPAASGRIEPGGRGGVIINMTVNTKDAASFSRNKTRIAGEMAAELAYRQRRGDI